MDLNRIRKFTYTVNTVIMLLVIGLAGFFYLCRATVLLWFSIPTFFVYVIGYFIIAKDRLDIYVRLVYFWLTLYMCLCTYCLGSSIGFPSVPKYFSSRIQPRSSSSIFRLAYPAAIANGSKKQFPKIVSSLPRNFPSCLYHTFSPAFPRHRPQPVCTAKR